MSIFLDRVTTLPPIIDITITQIIDLTTPVPPPITNGTSVSEASFVRANPLMTKKNFVEYGQTTTLFGFYV
uniref:Uncharacterized protein n=1 Tax=Strongyloides venezuelensis TaxID=75913 RepID=A0A0K0F943_STRVS